VIGVFARAKKEGRGGRTEVWRSGGIPRVRGVLLLHDMTWKALQSALIPQVMLLLHCCRHDASSQQHTVPSRRPGSCSRQQQHWRPGPALQQQQQQQPQAARQAAQQCPCSTGG
jgi:hypothetical protein